MSDDKIIYNKDGSLSALIGKEAAHLRRIQRVMSGIRMDIQTGGRMQLMQGGTIPRLLRIAGEYTGKKYKRTEKQQALDDLNVFFHTLKASLPEEVKKD